MMMMMMLLMQSEAWRGRRWIHVRGIGDNKTCGSDASLRDSWIFLLQLVSDASFRLNSSLIRITLTNIDRIEALVGQQPTRIVRRKLTVYTTPSPPN